MKNKKLIQFINSRARLFFLFGLFFTILFIVSLHTSFAQSLSTGIAYYVDIPGKTIQPGSIVSLSSHNYHLSSVAYDPAAFGVVVTNPAAYINDPNTISSTSYPTVHEGKAYLRVSTLNGKIAQGDILTTSSIPGVAEKATQDGYVVGTAIDAYDNSNIHKDGLIRANITFSFYSNPTNKTQNIVTYLENVVDNATLTPATLIRYIAATLIVLATLVLGIGHFGKVATTGIEALGRNPLASRLIMIGTIFNIGVMFTIIAAGIGAAYFILVL